MHLNELEQLSGAHNKQVTELESQISKLQVCASLYIITTCIHTELPFSCGIFVVKFRAEMITHVV